VLVRVPQVGRERITLAGHPVLAGEQVGEPLRGGSLESGLGAVGVRVHTADLARVAEGLRLGLEVAGDEEVRLVLDDGTAQRSAELPSVVVEEGGIGVVDELAALKLI